MHHRILLWFVFSTLSAFGHEGHGIPGALPPAPHGGVVQEAKHEEEEHGHEHEEAPHSEGDAEEPELFFEAVYKDKELKIYPLVLPSGANPMFQVLSPLKEFSSVGMKIEFPRAKVTQEVKPSVQTDAIRVAFDAKKVNRFLIHLVVKQGKEMKRATIQVENE